MLVSMIWAQDEFGAIGKGGTLPRHIPKDLAHFKRVTFGCPVVMGRKTFESLPFGALPGRLNIVLSRASAGDAFKGARCVRSLVAALELARDEVAAQMFVIGGSSIYEAVLPYAHHAHVTKVKTRVDLPDARAPRLPDFYELESRSNWIKSKAGLRFRTLVLKNNNATIAIQPAKTPHRHSDAP